MVLGIFFTQSVIKMKVLKAKQQKDCNMLLVLFSKEDPRLKISAHPRRKTSLDPVDLGPLPVSKQF